MGEWQTIRESLNGLGSDFQGKRTRDLVKDFLRDHLAVSKTKFCLPTELVRGVPERKVNPKTEIVTYPTKGHMLLMPEARTLLLNLLCLLALLERRHVAELLWKGCAPERDLADALDEVRKRAEISTRIWNCQHVLRERLTAGSLHLDSAPLLPETKAPPAPVQSATSRPANLVAGALHLYHLDEIAAEAPTAAAYAERAFHLLQIGSVALARDAANHALTLDPADPMGLAMRAVLLLTESSLARRHAAQRQFTIDEAPDLGDSALAGLEMEVASSMGEAQNHRSQALPLLVSALRSWPRSEGRVEMRDFHDEVTREALALLWASRAQIKGLVGQGALGATDAVHVLREDEIEADRMLDLRRWSSRALEDLRRLSLYRVLDEDQCKRFAKVWLGRLPDYNAEQALAILRNPEFAENLIELAPSRTNEIFAAMRTKIRAWAEGEVDSAESAIALAALRRNYAAGRFEEAVRAAQFGRLNMTGEPPLGLLYGGLRAAHDFLVQANGNSTATGKFLSTWGTALVGALEQISRVDRREYLTLVDDEYDEYRDVLRREADLLPSDGRQNLDGDQRGKLAPLLESLVAKRRSGPVAALVRAMLSAIEAPPSKASAAPAIRVQRTRRKKRRTSDGRGRART